MFPAFVPGALQIDLIRTSIYDKCSGSTKITAGLDHVCHCKTTSGTNWSMDLPSIHHEYLLASGGCVPINRPVRRCPTDRLPHVMLFGAESFNALSAPKNAFHSTLFVNSRKYVPWRVLNGSIRDVFTQWTESGSMKKCILSLQVFQVMRNLLEWPDESIRLNRSCSAGVHSFCL